MRMLMLTILLLSTQIGHANGTVTDRFLDFGPRSIGGFYPSKRVVIKNISKTQIQSIEGFSIDGDQFSFKTYKCNKPLKPNGGWCDIWFKFDPVRRGATTGTFTILYASGDVTYWHLTGEGYD